MKKKFLCALVVIVSLSSLQVGATENNNKGYLKKLIENSTKIKTVNKDIDVKYDNERNIPRFVDGTLSQSPVKNESEALNYLNENQDAFNLKLGQFKLMTSEKDSLGYSHYKAQYIINDIAVYGSEIVLHVNKDNVVYAVNGQAEPEIENKDFSNDFKISAEEAIEAALNSVDIKADEASKKESTKYIKKINDKWMAVYSIDLSKIGQSWNIIVNSLDGNILEKNDMNISSHTEGQGKDLDGNLRKLNLNYKDTKYYMEDVSNPGEIITTDAQYGQQYLYSITSNTNSFTSEETRVAVDAHTNVGRAYNYYKENFNRDGFDGKGGTMYVAVHFGKNYDNAFSSDFNNDDSILCFGDGNGTTTKNYAKAKDVVGHEYTHSVIGKTANLEYKNQSGALNESFADIFGTIIEGDANDWLQGEDACVTPGSAIRSMSNPSKFNQPENMSNYYNTSEDNGGVHINSGIHNKAFYLLAKEIGFKDAGSIYYRALTNYLISTSNFLDARHSVEQSSKDLFGTKYDTIIATAYDSVGIKDTSSGGGQTPDDGTAWTINKQYNVGDIVTFNGKKYKCRIAHYSITGWTPDITPSLWSTIS